MNNWVCSKNDEGWKVESRTAITCEEEIDTLTIPATIASIMSTHIWKENRDVTLGQTTLSMTSHCTRKVSGQPIGVVDCFQRKYNLLDCNCQIFAHQFVGRLKTLTENKN